MSPTASTLPDRLDATDGSNAAAAWLRQNGLPSSRDEAWKYTDLKEVLATPCDFPAEPSSPGLGSGDVSALVADLGGPTLVFVDGFFSAELSSGLEGEDGIVIGVIDSADMDRSLPSGRVDGFQMLNHATVTQGVLVEVGAGESIDGPVHIVNLTTPAGMEALTQPHVTVKVGAASVVTLVESYAGTGGSGLTNAVTSFIVDSDATVTHISVQNQVPSVNHLAHVSVRQMRGSTFASTSIALGSSVARSSVDVVAAQDDTTTQLEGLYLPSGSQRHDNVVTVQHSASHGSSTQVYKGVIDDRARGSFSGHIIVDAGTVATDAHQSNRSILLDAVAQSDSRPWLEIFADDVACTHGSAIGRLDDEALFYLQSRGIPIDQARSILIGGFVNEVVEHIEVEALREYVAEIVSDKVGER